MINFERYAANITYWMEKDCDFILAVFQATGRDFNSVMECMDWLGQEYVELDGEELDLLKAVEKYLEEEGGELVCFAKKIEATERPILEIQWEDENGWGGSLELPAWNRFKGLELWREYNF